jgi:CDP-4-dehydro-6-deoxyglucose reductase, E1
MDKISLVRDTIDKNDLELLVKWLQTNPILTKNKLTVEFEEKFSTYQNRKYSVFLNSGSSANLAMIYSLIVSGKLKNKNIIVPAVSWTTTVTPIIQLGLNPILCEADKDTLGLDIKHLEELIIKHDPSVVMLVHVLGVPNKMNEIIKLCEDNNIILLEDSCESLGSTYNNIKTGSFGLMSSFSFFYGHIISTIEGGMVCTDDYDLYNILKSIRAHGWNRDLDEDFKLKLKEGFEVDSFKDMYTFYYPGFNLRSTDLQAFIGIHQLDKLESIVEKRHKNYVIYDNTIKNNYWKVKQTENSYVCNFAYPIIHPNIKQIANSLIQSNVETRPLICGSIGNQPYWIKLYGKTSFEFADIIDKYGLYIPNNPDLKVEEVMYICDIINKNILDKK